MDSYLSVIIDFCSSIIFPQHFCTHTKNEIDKRNLWRQIIREVKPTIRSDIIVMLSNTWNAFGLHVHQKSEIISSTITMSCEFSEDLSPTPISYSAMHVCTFGRIYHICMCPLTLAYKPDCISCIDMLVDNIEYSRLRSCLCYRFVDINKWTDD